MTKRDEAVFVKAFEKMEAKGYFVELRARAKLKAEAKSEALKTAKKPREQAVADSVPSSISNRGAMAKLPLAAHKK
jgi:hypothetical protein